VERTAKPEPHPPEQQEEAAQPERQYAPSWTSILLAAAGILSILAPGLKLLWRERPPGIPVIRVTVGAPANTTFARTDGTIKSISVSPDGRRVVYGVQSGHSSLLWVRSLDQFEAQPLAGTENAAFPFWSADSHSIGFAAGGKLKKVDLGGGPQVTLSGAANFRGGTWARDGLVLFASEPGRGLQRVTAAGEDSSATTRTDHATGDEDRLWPWFLPDARHYLFSTPVTSGGGRFAVRAGSLDSTESKIVLEAESNAVFASGYLLFLRDSTLIAQPFDAKRLITTGTPIPVAEKVGCLPTGKGAFSVSENGVLVYGVRQQKQLTWVDRQGRAISTVGDPGALGRMHLSPDRRSAAIAVTAGNNTNIWVYDAMRGPRARFPFDPGVQMIGVWSPDSRTIIFDSNRKGRHDLYRRAADGTGGEELLYADGLEKGPSNWSPDGKTLLYNALSPGTGWDIWALPLTSDKPRPYAFLQTPFNEQQGQFSPDGQWVLYQSDESGRAEIYVTRFPVPGGKRRISAAGGAQPRWRPDGKEVFYVSLDGRLSVVQVSRKSGTLEFAGAQTLFGLLIPDQGFAYDVSDDGKRFLVETASQGDAVAANDVLMLVQNWAAGLKK
jgi:Tol biopolymer transport system component